VYRGFGVYCDSISSVAASATATTARNGDYIFGVALMIVSAKLGWARQLPRCKGEPKT